MTYFGSKSASDEVTEVVWPKRDAAAEVAATEPGRKNRSQVAKG